MNYGDRKGLEMAGKDYTLEELKKEENALDQCSALTHIVLDMLEVKRRECKMFFIALIISILVNLGIVGISMYVITGFDYEETVTTTTTTEQAVDGESSSINNVRGDQYNDKAKHEDKVD